CICLFPADLGRLGLLCLVSVIPFWTERRSHLWGIPDLIIQQFYNRLKDTCLIAFLYRQVYIH
ncbi:MAG: hypothetical protein IK117_06540, partial [Bacteroidales bacterium]|nr:hypothetical protein [Bacteroidales bacterium]